MPPRPLTRLRKLCLALPEAHEVEAWGEPTWRVRNKIFAMQAAEGHHGNGRASVWLKAQPVNQQLLLREDADRYFYPPYVGHSGWIGVHLDADTDWSSLAELIEDAWRLAAPKRLLPRLDDR